ncbi:MAG: methylmalonyl-CoA mutase [Deltaproteobacteria bacterium RBG_16_47_11]|jgi:methylmalonyl-CoA mutase C-terminal domain/subunit|nr:MAG: methylmalonyl-CoA mutase [Deltaproteobacteria bacterium RBG_16_47_11]
MPKRKIRVLIAKVGLDGHDRGAKIVARALRDSGMEVIYTGLRQTVDQVVNAALQEDVDVLGMSFLSGDHMVFVPKVIQGLKEKKKDDAMVLLGGIILKRQIPDLMKMGVDKVFLPGTPAGEIAKYIEEKLASSC